MRKVLVLFLLLACATGAQVLNPIMFGIDPVIPGPTNTDSGGSCSGAATSRTCTGTTTVSWADASADFIRYTNDGSTTPTFTTGTLYTVGISTAVTTTYKAVGCKVQNRKCSTVTTSVYTISAGSSPTRVNGTACHAFGSPFTCTLSVTSGNIIVYGAGWFNTNGALTVTDNGCSTGSYTTIDTSSAVSTYGLGQHGWVNIGTTKSCTFTFTYTGTAGAGDAIVYQVNGQNSVPIDGHAINGQVNPSGTNGVTSGAVTTANTDLCIGWSTDLSGSAATLTAGTNIAWTKQDSDPAFPIADEDFTQSGSGSITADLNYSILFGKMVTGIVCVTH